MGMTMIKIDLLKNYPEAIPQLAQIWHEVLGKVWVPDVPVSRVIERFYEHLNDNSLPLTFVAIENNTPVGMCSLRSNDGIRPDLEPWLGSLVVDPIHQKKGIGKKLIDVTKAKAKEMGYPKLYLFAFDPTVPDYYARLGWAHIGMDKFKGHSVTVMEIEL